MIDLYNFAPAPSLGGCRVGAPYILDDWTSQRLHPIDGQTITFEDRWMQLRITGDKRLSLDALRALTAPAR